MIRAALIWLCLALPAAAQDFTGLARVDMAQSAVTDQGGGLVVDLTLSQTVPYRVFTLTAPPRLVLDFREIDWTGVSRAALLNADNALDLRFGAFRPGWSRMVVDLAGPFALETAGLVADTDTGRAALTVRLVPTDPADFAARSGTPQAPGWDLTPPVASLPAIVPDPDRPITVMIDPGHGGIDPGAIRDGIAEAPLMLSLSIALAEALNRSGQVRALLTRDTDIFVPLSERLTRARAARADLFISLHADALEEDAATGATIYTLSEDGEDASARRMAERHDRGDLLAGLDLGDQDDRVASVLMDLARLETGPASERFADRLVSALRDNEARVNSNPRRSGPLAVLNAADFASVLVELGFLSSEADRAALTSIEGRARIVDALTRAILTWAAEEEARQPLLRQ